MKKSTQERAILFPQTLVTKSRAFQVVDGVRRIEDIPFPEDNSKKDGIVLIDGKGYLGLEDNIVRIYSAYGKPSNASVYPYFWFNENEEIEMSHPSEEVLAEFSKDMMLDLSEANILLNTPESVDELYNKEEKEAIASSSKKFIPTINESDDFLKKLVKTVINEKGLDINILKSKMNKIYGIPNMKSALTNTTKMSTNYFSQWMEIMGCNFRIEIVDNGSKKDYPLKVNVVYKSPLDKIEKHDQDLSVVELDKEDNK